MLLLVFALLLASPVQAAELLRQRLEVADGLPTSWTSAVAEDHHGFMWFGGPGWLARYDSVRMQHWQSPEPAVWGTTNIVPLSDGTVVCRTSGGHVLRVEGTELVHLTDPEGEHTKAAFISRAEDGGVLVTRGGALWHWSTDGGWRKLLDDVSGEPIQRAFAGREGSLYLASKTGWHRHRDGASERMVDTSRPYAVALDGDLTWYVSHFPYRIWLQQGDTPPRLVRENHGSAYMLPDAHDGALFTSIDGHLARIDPSGHRTRYARENSHAHGTLLLDSRGGLWITSFRGVSYISQPDVERWSLDSGMVTSTVRDAVRWNDDIWVVTWSGLHHLDHNGVISVGLDDLSKSFACSDDTGSLWVKTFEEAKGSTWTALRPDGSTRAWPSPHIGSGAANCFHAPHDGLWLLDGDDILQAQGPDTPPQLRATLPVPVQSFAHHILVTRDGWLWAGGEPAYCGIPVDQLTGDTPPPADAWTCHDTPGGFTSSDVHQADSGAVWLLKRDLGLLEITPDGIVPVPVADALPVDDLRGLAPSPRGGTWLVGIGSVVRVEETPDGVAVVETIPNWLGRSVAAVVGAMEEADGTLWLSTDTGLVRVPKQVRDRSPAAPRLRLTEALVDGQPITGPIGLDQQVSLEFTALVYQAPRLVRYRHRIDSGPWSQPTAAATLSLQGLGVGQHRVEVQASLDERVWSNNPIEVTFSVAAPWWQRTEVLLALAAVAVFLGFAVQWIRNRIQQRAQQLRTRVAMDLHDELGAGLASMGLIAGLIARGAGSRTPALAERIATDAQSLGTGLSGIVWTLRPGHDTAGALLAYVEHRATALLPDLLPAAVVVDSAPGLHDIRLDLDVLRAVQLVALEALTNVARHANTPEVRVRLIQRGRWLELRIEDDGIGFEPAHTTTAPDRGLGVSSMRVRMKDVGGSVAFDSAPGRGTRVVVRFRPGRSFWTRLLGGPG